jgi:hypothetical protein
MKVIVCGSTSIGFDKEAFIELSLLKILHEEQLDKSLPASAFEIVTGNNSKGADWFAERFARKNKLTLKLFPAEWNNTNPSRPAGWGDNPVFMGKDNFYGTYNILARYLSNQEMVNYAYNNGGGLCIAFDDEKGNKKTATKDMITRARKAWLKVYRIKWYDPDNVKIKVYNEGLQRE